MDFNERTEMKLTIQEVIEQVFTSPNVSDSNFEAANLVDVVNFASNGLHRIASSITPKDCARAPMETFNGGRVGSLTEAVIYGADQMGRIADALEEIALAIHKKGG